MEFSLPGGLISPDVSLGVIRPRLVMPTVGHMPEAAERETHYDFAFATGYRLPALLFGVTPLTTGVTLGPEGLRVRFGPWRLRTTIANVASVQTTGGFRWLTTAGPAHLSLPTAG